MAVVDLVFPILGESVSQQHAYDLYAAVCRIVPGFHENNAVGIFAIRGVSTGNGQLALNERSSLRLRLPTESIPHALPLSGKPLELNGARLRIGVPRVIALVPAATLISNFVFIKLAHADETGVTLELFLEAARKQLGDKNIKGEPSIPLAQSGPHAGEPRRRVLRMKDQSLVGYSLLVEGLTAEESIVLQEEGIGGKRRMGCGLFVAMK